MNTEKKTIHVERGFYPSYYYNDLQYIPLCSCTTDNGERIAAYLNEDSQDVLVALNSDKVIIGLFSVLPDRVDQLLQYMEHCVSQSKGNVYAFHEPEMQRLLGLSQKEYPRLSKACGMETEKDTSIFMSITQLFKGTKRNHHTSLPSALIEQIQAHTYPAEYVQVRPIQSYAPSDEDLKHIQEQSTPDLESLLPKVTPVHSLPDGWEWRDWDDGSGALTAPNGKTYFEYDLAPYAKQDGIEYKEGAGLGWSIYYGSLAAFKEHAQSVVGQKYIKETQPLSDLIVQASNTRAQRKTEPQAQKETQLQH